MRCDVYFEEDLGYSGPAKEGEFRLLIIELEKCWDDTVIAKTNLKSLAGEQRLVKAHKGGILAILNDGEWVQANCPADHPELHPAYARYLTSVQ